MGCAVQEWMAGLLEAEKCDAGSALWALGGDYVDAHEEVWLDPDTQLSSDTTRDWTVGGFVIRESRLFNDHKLAAQLAVGVGVPEVLEGLTEADRIFPARIVARIVRAAALTPEAIAIFEQTFAEPPHAD